MLSKLNNLNKDFIIGTSILFYYDTVSYLLFLIKFLINCLITLIIKATSFILY